MLEKLDPIFSKISERAKADQAEAEVLAMAREGLSISSEKKKLGKFSSNMSLSAGLRVIKSGAEGYSSTENLSEESLLRAYAEALENAEFNSKQGVSDKDLSMIGRQSGYRTLSRKHLEIDPSEIESKINKTIEMEEACFVSDKRVVSVAYNGYSEQNYEIRVFNTNGVDQTYIDSSVSAFAYPLVKEGDTSKMASETFFTRDPKSFKPQAIAEAATKRAAAKLGAIQPQTGKYPVLLEREPAEALIDLLLEYFSGKSVHEKLSVYEGKLDQKIASDLLTIIDDPFLDEGLASRPFDSEGTPSQPVKLVENGVLKSYLLNSIYAKKLGLKNTGHASRSPMGALDIGSTNVVVKPGSQSKEDLIKRHARTIVITDITGLHAGFQSGSSDFAFQAEGELWENGKRVAPLSDFVLSGNLREMLTKIEAIASFPNGKPAKIESSVVTPEILISELSIAGKS